MNFLGIHVTNDGIFTSEGDRITSPPYLDFLLSKSPDYQIVVYDLDAAVASLYKLLELTREQCQRLFSKGKLFLSPYRITYFPHHFFAADYGSWKGHPTINLIPMNQEGYLKPIYSKDNSPDDAIAKAKEAKNTAVRISKAFEALGLATTNISSPIQSFLKKHSLNWPTEEDCPDLATELSWNAIKGHWFENFAIGLFSKAYMFDRNGSYADCLANLPDIRFGTFSESTTPPDKAMLGIAEGLLSTESEFHPFLTRIGKNNYTPIGNKIPTILSLQEIQFLKQWQLGDFRADKGIWWQPTELKYPYKGILTWLWNKKQSSQDQTIRSIITRLYASLWGLQSQYLADKKRFGDYFNSFINYTVESNSRLHVAEACLQNKIIPRAILGDGFISDMELPLELSTKMGGWKLAKQGQCLIAGSGAIAFQNDKSPSGLALHFNTIIEQIHAKPKARQYPRNKYSPVTLGAALQQNFDELGMIKKVEQNLSIGTDNKRIYMERPKNGSELISGKVYKSSPWAYSALTTTQNLADRITAYEDDTE